MILHCNSCGFETDIDIQKVIKGTSIFPDFCPHCKSAGLCLIKSRKKPAFLIIWQFCSAVTGILPFFLLMEAFDGKNNSLFFLSFFMSCIGFCIAGFAPIYIPGFIMRRINKKRLKDVKIAAEQKEYKNAEKLYTDIISSNPMNADMYFERGKIRLKKSAPALAFNDFTTALLLEDDNFDFLYFKAIALMRFMNEDKTKNAIEIFDNLIVNGYIKSGCFNYRGECYASLREYYTALEDFKKALKLAPDNELYIKNRNSVLSKLAEIQGGSKQYEPEEMQIKHTAQEPEKRKKNLYQKIIK